MRIYFDQQPTDPANTVGAQNPTSVGTKAIYVNQKIVDTLKSAIRQDAEPFDELPSTRVLLDDVVSQMIDSFNFDGTTWVPYYYYKGHVNGKEQNYCWYDSEIVRRIHANEQVKNKGAWVEALLLFYLKGEGAFKDLTLSRKIKPRRISEIEIRKIREHQAGMPAAKDVQSKFDPTTFTGEIPG